MSFLQFYRYLLNLMSSKGVCKAIATFQALLRQEPKLYEYLKQSSWDTPAQRILDLESIELGKSHTEIELHFALMGLMQAIERYHRLNTVDKANFNAKVTDSKESAQNQDIDSTRIQNLLSELYKFSPITIEHLMQIGNLLKFQKGRKILIGDESKHKVAILLKGAVRGYYKKAPKKEITLFALTEGAVIADFNRLFNQEDEFKLIFECFEDCEILVFNYSALELKQIQHHAISLDTQKFLEAQLIESLARLKFLILNDGKQRVKGLNDSDRAFLQRFNRKDMACYIALTPEAFARISKALKESQRKKKEEEEAPIQDFEGPKKKLIDPLAQLSDESQFT